MGSISNKFSIGDKVKINEKCAPEYIGVTGTIIEIDSGHKYDDFVLHIKFDEPIGTLDNEYFSVEEVDKYVYL